MINNIELTNLEIYNLATALGEAFNGQDIAFPIKVNFYLTKNTTAITNLGREVEEGRMKIIQKYGSPEESGETYTIPAENIEKAQSELQELLEITQTVGIYKVSIEEFGDVNLTQSQMAALMFMIEEGE